jgi:hypothetical protein
MDHGTTLLDQHRSAFVDEPGTGVRRSSAPSRSPYSARRTSFSLSELWRGLTTGQLRARTHAADQARDMLRHTLRVAAVRGEATPLSAGDAASLSRFLRGDLNKWIALEATAATSSVSRQQSRCLELMGFGERPSRAPVVLALAAHAAAGACLGSAAVEWQSDAGEPSMLLSVERVDTDLERTLSPKVLSALRAFIDGETHVQIAAHAGRSKNTIGNQLRIASELLRASGRFGVIARLVERRGAVAAQESA